MFVVRRWSSVLRAPRKSCWQCRFVVPGALRIMSVLHPISITCAIGRLTAKGRAIHTKSRNGEQRNREQFHSALVKQGSSPKTPAGFANQAQKSSNRKWRIRAKCPRALFTLAVQTESRTRGIRIRAARKTRCPDEIAGLSWPLSTYVSNGVETMSRARVQRRREGKRQVSR